MGFNRKLLRGTCWYIITWSCYCHFLLFGKGVKFGVGQQVGVVSTPSRSCEQKPTPVQTACYSNNQPWQCGYFMMYLPWTSNRNNGALK